MDPWDAEAAAVLLAWYPGMEGGHAIADVLLGDAEPAGRLPMAVPHRQSDLPQVDWGADTVTCGRWWGQRKLDREGARAAYPLGFGVGYDVPVSRRRRGRARSAVNDSALQSPSPTQGPSRSARRSDLRPAGRRHRADGASPGRLPVGGSGAGEL